MGSDEGAETKQL